ncbi:DUF3224 domain-containing protein [Actinoplanes xinjiangensis]|uniref:DUF3224 domain-containing protein n=1 Tax=Actinoplanes xinjiangensis TaxID=512350 RepID=UPI00344ABBEC
MDARLLAEGRVVVDFDPLPAHDDAISRMAVERTFTGGLTGKSVGQLLSVGTSIEGSSAFVALEVFTGTLGSRAGTFTLQYAGSMRRGFEERVITVVPDSGTEELIGLSGVLTVVNHATEHTYTLQYSWRTADS